MADLVQDPRRRPQAPNRVPVVRVAALVHWPIVALAVVPCVLFVAVVVLALVPGPRASVSRSVPAAPALPSTPAAAAPEADDLARAEITIPPHHAMAAISDLPVFEVENPAPAARPVEPVNPIVPVPPVPEKSEKDGCFGTAVHFLPTPMEAFKAAQKEKRLTMILHVSGNFEDSGFT